MEDKEYKKLLPIGTVVLLKGGTKRLMITGFYPAKDNDGDIQLYDYCGVGYPEGVLTTKKALLFNHVDIAKICYMGLQDDEEERDFKKKLMKILDEV